MTPYVAGAASSTFVDCTTHTSDRASVASEERRPEQPENLAEAYGPWGPDGLPESVMRLVSDWFARAFDAFRASDAFGNLSEEQRLLSLAILRNFVLMMLVEVGETPQEWSASGLDFLFGDLVPHDVAQPEGYDESFASVLHVFLVWLADAGHLPHARSLAADLRQYLPQAHERCDCGIRTEALDMAERVMEETGLRPESLHDRAIYIARYTEMVSGALDDQSQRTPEAVSAVPMGMSMLCPCGSGRRFDRCCGGVN